jgi:DamX protein
MSDSDSLIYQKKLLNVRQSKASVKSLISVERAQKLDLLIHLISNLTQPLVICGPLGVGKSTLIKVLRETKRDSWPICSIAASSAMSFESISDQFARQLGQMEKTLMGENLPACLSHFQRKKQKIVLIIDDAGSLMPGLITSLIEFADANEDVRLVLTLTHDELHLKDSSDKIIDECHFIEVPPLTRKQCGTFLQNLSAQRSSGISFNAVTDVLVDNLYGQTHGIPGRIIAELPNLSNYQSRSNVKWGFVLLSAGLLLAMGWLLYDSRPEPKKNNTLLTESVISNKSTDIKVSVPVLDTQKRPELDQESVVVTESSDSVQETVVPVPVIAEVSEVTVADGEPLVADERDVVADATNKSEKMSQSHDSADIRSENSVPVEKVKSKKIPEEQSVELKQLETPLADVKGSEKSDGRLWLKAQSPKHYTYQLMVLSQRQSVLDLLNKYPALGDDIKFIEVSRLGKHQYILVYGSYQTASQAKQAKNRFPKAFRQAWLRRFSVLQKQISDN